MGGGGMPPGMPGMPGLGGGMPGGMPGLPGIMGGGKGKPSKKPLRNALVTLRKNATAFGIKEKWH